MRQLRLYGVCRSDERCHERLQLRRRLDRQGTDSAHSRRVRPGGRSEAGRRTGRPAALWLISERLYVNTYFNAATSVYIEPGDTVTVVSGKPDGQHPGRQPGRTPVCGPGHRRRRGARRRLTAGCGGEGPSCLEAGYGQRGWGLRSRQSLRSPQCSNCSADEQDGELELRRLRPRVLQTCGRERGLYDLLQPHDARVRELEYRYRSPAS